MIFGIIGITARSWECGTPEKREWECGTLLNKEWKYGTLVKNERESEIRTLFVDPMIMMS